MSLIYKGKKILGLDKGQKIDTIKNDYSSIIVEIPSDNYTLQLCTDERQIVESGFIYWGDYNHNNISATNILMPNLNLMGMDDVEEEPFLEDFETYEDYIKAWNEWGEGNYMEPDLKYGFGYLQALKEVIFDKD